VRGDAAGFAGVDELDAVVSSVDLRQPPFKNVRVRRRMKPTIFLFIVLRHL